MSAHVCSLSTPGDPLPGDLALSMQLCGVRVIATGVTWSEGAQTWAGWYEQPPEVTDLLDGVCGDRG